ncbi:DUF397 domain-containing protein [Streptomyces uncialis]|uniref:DUF397 domain-containing protein n=1 Tax=Streptomyces uncialis TaxID=1048205 RepID=UPI0038140D2E
MTAASSSPTGWIASSYSTNGGNCVEWAPGHAAVHGVVPVRDSKVAAGPVLLVGVEGWAGLVELARRTDV